MTKKKSILTLIFSICFIVPAMFMLTACGHNHKAVAEWSIDDTYHWHVCEGENCEEQLDKAEHTWDAGVITTQATETTQATKTYTCTVCKKQKTEVVTKLDAGLGFSTSYNPSKVYDGDYAEDPILSDGDYTCASDGVVSFAWYEKVGDTYSEEPLSDPDLGLCPPTDAGTYKLVMSVPETKNYLSAKVEKEVVVSPKEINISNTNLTKVYGTAVSKTETSGYNYFALDEILSEMITEEEGLVNGDELYLRIKMSSKNVGSTIVSKKLVCGDVENTNYVLKNADAITAEITKKNITGSFNLSAVYSGSFGTLVARTWAKDGFYNEEFAKLFIAGDKLEISNGGVCDVTNGPKAWANAVLNGDDAGNYNISDLELTYEITPATLKFTQATLTKEYDKTSTFTYTFTTEDGLKYGTTCTLTFTVKDADDNDIKNVGEYTNFDVDDKNATLSNSNYKVDYSQSPIFTNNGGKLVINKRVLSGLSLTTTNKSGTECYVVASLSNTPELIWRAEDDCDTLRYIVIVSDEQSWSEGRLVLIPDDGTLEQGQAKIEFDTTYSDDYQNYEFATSEVGTLTITSAS